MKDNPIIIKQQTATKTEGSCVTIDCSYAFQQKVDLLWIKDHKWNARASDFDGVIVYSNKEERPQASEYSGRVEFSNKTGNCTLKINDLKKNDNGTYAFRYYTKENLKVISQTTFNLTVTDNPCKVHIKPPNLKKSLKEGDNVNLYCAASAACKFHPEWQSFGNDLCTRNQDVEKCSKLNLTVMWTDDGRTLTCRPSRSSDKCLERTITLSVEYAPKETKVIDGSSSKDVKEGEQITMSCSSKAHPKAHFTWFKHNSSFSQSGENLILDKMTPEQGGIFFCEAKNEHGTERTDDTKINVIYAPKGVSISPESVKVKEGDSLVLTCFVQNSNPAVEVQSYSWYKDDQEIISKTSNTFTLSSVKRINNGKYDCQARNSVGETRSTQSTQVSVHYIPQNTYIQGANEIKLGFELNLECVTEADPLPTNYYWYFKPQHEQWFTTLSHTNKVYRIEKVAVSNAGSYKCSAQNAVGRGADSTALNVLVLYPPTKPTLTMKQDVKENEFYSITCTVESSPQAMLILSRSSLTNPEKDTIILESVESNFLNFTTKAAVSDAGIYTCHANNSQGKNFTQYQLKILYAPKNVTASAHPGEELKEGSNLELTCKADSVPQVSAYTWKKKSVGTHSETVGHGQKLTLHFLKSSSSGHYFCIASNELGSDKSSAIYIRVKYRPRITIIHNMTKLGLWQEAAPIYMSCSVQCDPPATSFAWYKLEKNSTLLSNSQNYTVQPQNPGIYYCFAKNEVGESRSEPLSVYRNDFIIKWLIISFLIILFLIPLIFLLYRIARKKRSGKNEDDQRSFFVSTASSLPNGSRNNIRENLMVEVSVDPTGFRDNHSNTAVHSNPPANRTKQTERPNPNIHTVYDAIKLPSSMLQQHQHTGEDFTMTTVNYPSSNPNERHEACGPVYAEVTKKKQIAKERQSGHDYENVSGACAQKGPFPNINWESDSSDSEEEEVTYTKVFTVTSHHNPQRDVFSSDEEDKIEYSEVKI